MIRIILENERELELIGNEIINLNYSIADVDISKRNTPYSKTFSIPGTKANNIILEHYWDTNSDGFNPNLKINASLIEDSNEVFTGYLQVNSVIRNEESNTIYYEVIFISDLSRFLYDINVKKLNELQSLTAHTHTWNFTNVYNSWLSPKGYGYIYPLLNNGNFTLNTINQSNVNKSINLQSIKPAIYVKSVIDAIFADAGYSYDCDLFQTEKFKSLIMTCNTVKKNELFLFNNKFNIYLSGDTNCDPYSASITTGKTFLVGLDVNYGLGFDNNNNWNTSTFSYTPTENLRCSFNLNWGCYTNYTGVSTVLVNTSQHIRVNGINVHSNFYNFSSLNGTGATWSYSTPQLTLEAGDVVDVTFNYIPRPITGPGAAFPYDFKLESNSTSIRLDDIDPNAIVGDVIRMEDIIGSDQQVKFLKDIFLLFNLFISNANDSNRIITIKTRDQYYKDSSTAVDWSSKLDISKKISFSPPSELVERTFNFTWNDPDDYFNKIYTFRENIKYGEYFHNLENDLLPLTSKKEIKPSKFCIPINRNVQDSKWINLPCTFQLDANNEVSAVQNKTYLMFYNGIQELPVNEKYTIYYNSGITYQIVRKYPHTSVFYGNWNEPEFGLIWDNPQEYFYYSTGGTFNFPTNNLYTDYYQNTIEEITNKESKILTCYINLNSNDISNLDYSKQVYLSIDGGSYWKILSINDYIVGTNKVCKVKLLKSLNLIPKIAPIRARQLIKKGDSFSAIEKINYGKNNRILGDSNLVVGASNTTDDYSFYNILLGSDNAIKNNSENNLITGENNLIFGNNNVSIGNSGTSIFNNSHTSIIGSKNITVDDYDFENVFIANSSNVNIPTLTGESKNLAIINSSNLILTGDSSFQTYIGLSTTTIGGHNNMVYMPDLTLVNQTGLTTSVAGIQTDGKIIQLPMSGFTSGITTGGSFINNGLNTYTGGTPNFQNVNISALTINNLTVSGFTNLNTLSATTLQVRNLSGGTTRMVVANTTGIISTQIIPSFTQYWVVGSVASALKQNNGYTTASSNYSLVAGKTNIINTNNPYANILGGNSNIIKENSKHSLIGNGLQNYVKNFSEYSLIANGRANYIHHSNKSSIINGYLNKIYNSHSYGVSQYNSIINGKQNKLIRGLHNCIIGGYNNVIGVLDNLTKYSTILGGKNYLLVEDYTVLTPKLKIGNLPTTTGTYMLVANSSGNVFKNAMPSGVSFLSNGLNTYTGGTASNPRVNVSALTINSITVSGNSTFNTLTATTLFSGSTNLNAIFSHINHTHQFSAILNTAHTHSVSEIDNLNNSLNTKLNLSGGTMTGGLITPSLSATTISGGTLFSGSTNLNSIFSNVNHTHEFNTILNTAHTHTISQIDNLLGSLNTKLNLSGGTMTGGLIAPSLSATTLSGGTLFSGSTNLNSIFSSIGHTHEFASILNTAHTHSISEIDNLLGSLNTKLNLSGGTMTGGLIAPSLSATTISGGTLFSGTTNLSSIFLNSNSLSAGTNITLSAISNSITINSSYPHTGFLTPNNTNGVGSPKRYYHNTLNFVSSMGVVAPGANTLRLFPFVNNRTITVNEIGVNCTTSGTSGVVALAIYDSLPNAELRPNNLLHMFGSASTTTTGVKLITGSTITLSPGMFWFAINNNSTAQFSSPASGCISLGSNSAISTQVASMSSAVTFSMNFPSSMSGASTYAQTTLLFSYHPLTVL